MKIKMNTGRDAIAVALAAAYDAAANTGSRIGEVCALASTAYKGGEIPADDVEHIVTKVADAREWDGATLKVRSSEVRKVLGVYSTLPEGIARVREKSGGCNWQGALRLATLLKKHENKLKPALAAFYAKSEADKANYAGRASKALKAWYENARGDKRAKILSAAELLGLTLGVKA
jgi:hypothetical protein